MLDNNFMQSVSRSRLFRHVFLRFDVLGVAKSIILSSSIKYNQLYFVYYEIIRKCFQIPGTLRNYNISSFSY